MFPEIEENTINMVVSTTSGINEAIDNLLSQSRNGNEGKITI